jgi:carbonic anhydrase/acetyltransferase-like protein (isoleucine patch superfamily)
MSEEAVVSKTARVVGEVEVEKMRQKPRAQVGQRASRTLMRYAC